MRQRSLEDFFADQLQELDSAENWLLRAMRTRGTGASSETSQDALEEQSAPTPSSPGGASIAFS